MLISQNQEEIRAAIALQTRCELRSVWLFGSTASRAPSDVNLTQPYSLTVSHQSKARIDSKGLLSVEVEFQVNGIDSSSTPLPVFSLSCSYELTYLLDGSVLPSSDEINAFKDGNAVFNCWPYAREFVQNTCVRMGHATPPLPLLRIVPKPDPKPTAPTCEAAPQLKRRVKKRV